MSLKEQTCEKIRTLLINIVRTKLREYKPETNHMPFHFRLDYWEETDTPCSHSFSR